MTKPKHDDASFRRYMQMSTNSLFVFVEGKTDTYFYGHICDSICINSNVNYQICIASEFFTTGGKGTLIKFFRFLSDHGSLHDHTNGKETIALFFLDKDIDDFTGKLLTSEHIVYSKYYTVENHIVSEGNLVKASAAAASLEERSLSQKLAPNIDWRRSIALRWKPWVQLCFFCKKHDVSDANYAAVPIVEGTTTVDERTSPLARLKTEIERKSGCSNDDFSQKFTIVSDLVDSLYSADNFDMVCCGKWYLQALEDDIKIIAASRPYESGSIQHRLRTALMTTLDFDASWSDHFRQPLRSLIHRLPHTV